MTVVMLSPDPAASIENVTWDQSIISGKTLKDLTFDGLFAFNVSRWKENNKWKLLCKLPWQSLQTIKISLDSFNHRLMHTSMPKWTLLNNSYLVEALILFIDYSIVEKGSEGNKRKKVLFVSYWPSLRYLHYFVATSMKKTFLSHSNWLPLNVVSEAGQDDGEGQGRVEGARNDEAEAKAIRPAVSDWNKVIEVTHC